MNWSTDGPRKSCSLKTHHILPVGQSCRVKYFMVGLVGGKFGWAVGPRENCGPLHLLHASAEAAASTPAPAPDAGFRCRSPPQGHGRLNPAPAAFAKTIGNCPCLPAPEELPSAAGRAADAVDGGPTDTDARQTAIAREPCGCLPTLRRDLFLRQASRHSTAAERPSKENRAAR